MRNFSHWQIKLKINASKVSRILRKRKQYLETDKVSVVMELIIPLISEHLSDQTNFGDK
jgi:hypothetical protein